MTSKLASRRNDLGEYKFNWLCSMGSGFIIASAKLQQSDQINYSLGMIINNRENSAEKAKFYSFQHFTTIEN